jgi:hypothetical protein
MVFLLMPGDETSCFVKLVQCAENRPSLAPTLSCTQRFQKPLRNIKAEETGRVMWLIVIGEPPPFREVAKPLGHIQIIKTHVFAEGGLQVGALWLVFVCRQQEIGETHPEGHAHLPG